MKRKLTAAEARNGHIDYFGFNPDWKKQKAICGYEHCIELMPVMSVSRKEATAHNKYLKQCLKTKILGSGEPLDETRKQWFEEEVENFNPLKYSIRVNRSKSCPIFGHDCPGGKEMVQKCEISFEKIPKERIVSGSE